MFSEMQHMQQNDQKMLPKSTQRLHKSTPRRPRCSQDGLLEPTWAPKRLPRRSKNTQKGRVFLLFFRFLVPNAPKCPPGRPRQRNLEQKEPPRPPQTPSGPWFYYNFRRFGWHFERIFVMLCFPLFSPLLCFAFRCFTGSITNHPHYQNNASTRQPHFRNNISYPQRNRDMIASVCRK